MMASAMFPDVSLFSGDGFIQNFYVVCQRIRQERMQFEPVTYADFCNCGRHLSCDTSFCRRSHRNDRSENGLSSGQSQSHSLRPCSRNKPPQTATLSGTPVDRCVFDDVTWVRSRCRVMLLALPIASLIPSGDAIGILSGFDAGAGFDLATGLGSVNIGNLVGSFPDFQLSSSATTLTASSSTPGTATITVTSENGFAGTVALACGLADRRNLQL